MEPDEKKRGGSMCGFSSPPRHCLSPPLCSSPSHWGPRWLFPSRSLLLDATAPGTHRHFLSLNPTGWAFFERLGWELTLVRPLVSGDSHLGFTSYRPAVFAAIWSAVLSVIRVFLWRGEGNGAVRTSRENAQVRAELSAQGWGEADIFHQHRELWMDHLIVFPPLWVEFKACWCLEEVSVTLEIKDLDQYGDFGKK